MNHEKKIAVLIPCHNEEAAIGKVVEDFKRVVPEATIYVFENCCTDRTAEIAEQAGAVVIHEPRKGKGFVIESMFSRIDADVYLMVDGDDTYPAENAWDLINPVLNNQADMANGARLAEYTDDSFRPLHVAGNQLVRGLINKIFKAGLTDILTGYRAFNRKVVSTVPVVSEGFEVETEMTIQMLYYNLRIIEVTVPYRERPEGSVSKLNTFSDGFRVLWKLFSLARSFKPLTTFGLMGIFFFVMGILAGLKPVYQYFDHGEIESFPLAILATGLMLLSGGFVFLGLTLHAINFRFKELHNVLTRPRR